MSPATRERLAAVEPLLQAVGVQRPVPPDATAEDEAAEAADAAARPVLRAGRRARAPRPDRLSPGRAVAGAGVSVAGVLLGIGTLLWVTDDPSQGSGPVVSAPVAAEEEPVEPAVPLESLPASEPVLSVAPVAPVVPAEPPPAAAPPAPAVALEPVTVLNNSRVEGLADRAAAVFEDGGWPVKATGNFRGQIRSTTVYYEPGQADAARAFADRFDQVVRVLPRFEGLPARGLVVVVTRDFAG